MRWLGKAGLSDLVALWWVAGHTDWTFQGGGGRGERERTIYNKLLNKYCCDWNTVIHIYTSHDYKTEFMKSSIYFS